jgi:putative ABC transport system permease protein
VEDGFLWADDGFFDVFSFPMQRGAAALDRPGTVVLTTSMADKYFPDADPLGQRLRVGDAELEVTGVVENPPATSSLQFDFIGSLSTTQPDRTWGRNNWTTYVLLTDGADVDAVTTQMANLIDDAGAGTRPEQDANPFIPHLQPITGIHFGQGVSVEIGSTGTLLYVYLFVALALFILLMACVNFMNLATARSTERAQEVGVRKALGADRTQLAGQLWGEALLMSVIAAGLALLLTVLALPLLNDLAGTALSLGAAGAVGLLALIGLALLTGLIAGSYPAVALSRFQPAEVLRSLTGTTGGGRLRNGLVVFQFALSIALIVGTFTAFEQLHFMKSKGLGFEDDDLVLVENTRYLGDQLDTFLQEAEQLPGVTRATSGFSMPGTFFINSMWGPAEPDAAMQNMDYSFVGWDYVETLGIELVAGRSFDQARAADSSSVLLNEAAARDFGWTPEEAVGKRIGRGTTEFTVIGVMQDFHYRSLHAEIYPLLLFPPIQQQRYVALRTADGDLPETLTRLEATWAQFSDLPLTYSFLADDLAAQYRTEERLARLFGTFTGLAILIACLGLFGLAAFTARQRTKEIGIRKVLGASVAQIVALLSRDFLKLVGIAAVMATPVAYIALRRWLEGFAYHVDVGAMGFVLASVLAALIALATVSYQSIRAALADPAHSLRSE